MSITTSKLWLVTFILSATLFVRSAHAQSLDVHHPAQLREGANNATIDSFGGSQFWYCNIPSGNFKVVFARNDPQEGFSVGPKAGCGAIINPATPGSTISNKDVPNGVVFEGHCSSPSRVLVMVDPAKSPLVRQTNSYSLTVTGSSAGDAGNSEPADVVTGVYDAGTFYGAVKLGADGSITSTSGATGQWKLFDASTRTYSINLANEKWTVTFEPARGFVDRNGTLLLTVKKPAR